MEKAYKMIKILIWVLAFAVLIAGASLLYNDLSSQVEMETAATAAESDRQLIPDFPIYDRDENPYKLSDFRGKPVILNFWATWCGFCIQEMPDFQDFYEQYGEQIQFVMLNATDGQQETLEKATAFVDESGYTFPVYYDLSTAGVMTFGLNSFPTTIMIDAEGYLVSWKPGMMSAEDLQKAVDTLLG